MAEPTFWLLYTGKRKKPTLDTLRMIAVGMDIPLHELIRRIERPGRRSPGFITRNSSGPRRIATGV